MDRLQDDGGRTKEPSRQCTRSQKWPDSTFLLVVLEFSFFIPKVSVRDPSGSVVGRFKSKLFGFGISFRVLDPSGKDMALVKGDWKGWNFSFLDSSEKEIGTITKKWSGLGKELFTSADNYFIALNDQPEPAGAVLLLAAGLSVDTVYKE